MLTSKTCLQLVLYFAVTGRVGSQNSVQVKLFEESHS